MKYFTEPEISLGAIMICVVGDNERIAKEARAASEP